MRLLPKSEVDRAKAKEQRQEVEEGMKLAKRVDNLREVAAAEEASLEKFRRETVANIHAEITPLMTKRDELKGEVSVLEKRRDDALKPLDEAWAQLKKEESAIELRKSSVVERESKVSSKEIAAVEVKKEANSILLRAQTKDAISDKRLSDAESAAVEAENTRSAVQRASDVFMESRKVTEKALTNREDIVAGRETSATIKEIELSAREKELADGWRLLRDREAMLERTLKRNK